MRRRREAPRRRLCDDLRPANLHVTCDAGTSHPRVITEGFKRWSKGSSSRMTTIWCLLVVILFTGDSSSFLLPNHQGVAARNSGRHVPIPRIQFRRIRVPFYSRKRRRSPTSLDHSNVDKNEYQNKEKVHNESRKKRRDKKKDLEYDRRRQEWLDRYGSLEALQKTFGTENSSSLSPEQTRRLYHTLLPRSLLALYELGLMQPDELAPLAYEARMAAKEYARSQCVWYARVATEIFDDIRARKRQRNSDGGDGKKRSSSMSWEEIWSKYEVQIVQEECERLLQKYKDKGPVKAQQKAEKKLKRLREDDNSHLTMSIYLRILERSLVTNSAVDDMFLSIDDDNEKEQEVFNRMARQLDGDVKEILLRPKDRKRLDKKLEKLQQKMDKEEAKAQRKLEKQLQKDQKQQLKGKGIGEEPENDLDGTQTKAKDGFSSPIIASASTDADDVRVLRILAGTRRKFRDKIVDGERSGVDGSEE
ncbi:hypothetical protein ACHAWF_004168 [Thalassiosira exigua]